MSILKTCKFTQEAWADYLEIKSQDAKMAEKNKKVDTKYYGYAI